MLLVQNRKMVVHKRFFGFTTEKGRFAATCFIVIFYSPIDLEETEYEGGYKHDN